MENRRYQSIDGLRTFACIGIVMMHVQTNSTYQLSGFIYEKIIPSFTNLVFLFMVISAFGMCCGYLEKLMNNQMSLEDFYIKRYCRILPFFLVLILLDIAVSPSKEALIEGFADATLLYGLFPNDISVIGVGWFLGLIFAFYLIFPFYCALLKNKKRAWGTFAISLILNYVGGSYFGIGRNNIVYCMCYFIAGGLVYLYRNELEKFSRKYWWIVFGGIVMSVILYFTLGAYTPTMLLVSVMMLIFALGRQGGCRFTQFFGSISMEVYLSHMAIFRGIEKTGLNTVLGKGAVQYFASVMGTIIGAVVYSMLFKKAFSVIKNKKGMKACNENLND